jgi:hypothetical protein
MLHAESKPYTSTDYDNCVKAIIYVLFLSQQKSKLVIKSMIELFTAKTYNGSNSRNRAESIGKFVTSAAVLQSYTKIHETSFLSSHYVGTSFFGG